MKIIYDKPYLIREFCRNNEQYKLYFVKTKDKATGLDHYFFKLYTKNNIDGFCCIGYIYFFLDFIKRESLYIGSYVKEMYRNNGLASYLLATWIQFCLDYGIINLKTNHAQRKPFLLYILKKFSFEIKDIEKYIYSPYTILILKPISLEEKWLYFKNKGYQATFMRGKIMRADNYIIHDNLENKIILDTILLSNPYELQDENKAYERARRIIQP